MTRRNERGSAHLEVVLIAPIMILVLGWVLTWSRIAIAQDAVTSAAGAAARAAALERTPGKATQAGNAVAQATLTSRDLKCSSTTVTINTAGFHTPVGQKSSVSATVTCVVALGDLSLPSRGTKTITRTAAAPLDTYRGRGK